MTFDGNCSNESAWQQTLLKPEHKCNDKKIVNVDLYSVSAVAIKLKTTCTMDYHF